MNQAVNADGTLAPEHGSPRFCWKDLPGEEREAKLQAKATSDLLTARAGIPDDAARSYLYAICNPYLTGQTIVVDGDGSLT
jgi:NAD(P)-dependent dehydrogenase (short-subunit alcohol dehydrogenase family)